MNQLNYTIHLLISNRYYFIIKLLIFFCIYLSFYFPTISYCMTEGNDVPQVAESKEVYRPSHQILALKNEIERFAGTMADLTESNKKLQNEVEVLGEIINMQKKMINFPFEERLEYKRQIRSLQTEINVLENRIHFKDETIDDLRKELKKKST